MARVVVVAQRKGGTGKSTFAVSLAAVGSSRAFHCEMVDLDSQGNASAWALGTARVRSVSRETSAAMLEYPPARNWLPPGHPLLERNASRESVIEYVEVHCIHDSEVVPNLRVVPLAPHIHIEESKELLLRELPCDWVVVDTGADTSALPVRSAIAQADEIIVPVLPDSFSIWGAEHVLREVHSCGRSDLVESGRVRIVVNGRQRWALHDVAEREIRERFGELVSPLVVSRAAAISEAGAAPELLTKKNPIRKAAEALWDEIEKTTPGKQRAA